MPPEVVLVISHLGNNSDTLAQGVSLPSISSPSNVLSTCPPLTVGKALVLLSEILGRGHGVAAVGDFLFCVHVRSDVRQWIY